MRISRSLKVPAIFLLLLTGCDTRAMFEKFIPKEEAALARHVLDQVAARDFGAVEAQLDPSVRTASARAMLEQMASMFPAGEAKSVKTVGANTSRGGGVSTYNLTLEYEYPGTWLLGNVVLQKSGGRLRVLGLHVTPMKQSLEELNRFAFAGKGALHYVVFALALAIPLFIAITLVVCMRTPMAGRKWLWMLFMLFGFVQFSLNWADGTYAIRLISLQLLGAGFVRPGLYGPVILTIAFPLGAVLYLVKRQALMARGPEDDSPLEPSAESPESPDSAEADRQS